MTVILINKINSTKDLSMRTFKLPQFPHTILKTFEGAAEKYYHFLGIKSWYKKAKNVPWRQKT